MTAKALLDAGQLNAAIEQLNRDVKARPTDNRLRSFLFELLCFAGDYQRADRQLEVIGHQSAATEIGVQIYRNAMAAERKHQRTFTDGLQPHFLLEPPPYVHLHLEAVTHLRENRQEEAEALLEESSRTRPAVIGHLNGQPFTSLRDSDDLLAPFLEVIIHDNYIWLPFDQLKRVEIAAPQRLRDLLWTPAKIETYDGPAGEVLLPVLYAASNTHENDQIRLGRMTDWTPFGAGLARGAGQRLLLADDQEHAFLEVRTIELQRS